METSTAQTINKIIAVLGWIGSGFAILGGLAMLLGGSIFGSVLGSMGALFGGVIAIVGVFVIALGIFGIFLNLGLWRHRNWARIVTIVFAALGIIGALMNFVAGSIGSGVFSLIVDGFLIWFYAFNAGTKELFGSMG